VLARHAKGESIEALSKRYGIPASLIEKHVKLANQSQYPLECDSDYGI
jgi:hypothetical protein